LVQVWTKQGVLATDQRVPGSKLWVRVNAADLARLNGSTDCTHLPTIPEVMQHQQLTRSAVWNLVRSGHLHAYRVRHGKNWEWRLQPVAKPCIYEERTKSIGCDRIGVS
jgi:hypothetical protein